MRLSSFVYLETGVKKGTKVDYTIDLFTGIGSVILMHHDKEILEKDLNTIRQLEKDNALFEYEPEGVNLVKSFSKLNLSEMGAEGVTSPKAKAKKPGHHRVHSDRTDLFF
jgi:hypothetical protein